MPGFVVDASVACGWLLPDEQTSIADSALRLLLTHRAFVPDLLWHEVRNVMMMARRRKRISFEAVVEGMEKLRRLSLVTIPATDDSGVLKLSERHGLTAYDAAYLALAIEKDCALATLDKELIAAAIREDGVLSDFVKQRYSSYDDAVGKQIEDGTATFADLESYMLEKGNPDANQSGRQEMLENVVNDFL